MASSMYSNFLSQLSQSSSKQQLLKALSLTTRPHVAASTSSPNLCFLISWKAQLRARAVVLAGNACPVFTKSPLLFLTAGSEIPKPSVLS